MLTGTNQQIVTAYEELQMTPEEICSSLDDLELLSVKACLMQFSPKYREDTKKLINHDFADEELLEANATIIGLMRNTEDEHLKGRLARYVRDDKKGRLDVLSGLGKMNVNITVFNQRLIQAREAKAKSKLLPAPPSPHSDAPILKNEKEDIREAELVED